ncbi:serine protease FAM111A-like isoform X1 [Salvelinus namaycush]|uniref:Serine protease FAM111A-like isoform X1 n=1 Tax=Salvelinus namaycush TaxID=8040 RepID=A0A8U0R086_SALNM|nr:serine protease FAM111A-like isoform X1 [Salvelinus namaycush]XP_038852738.1 serine protease FAM111A-like isoform X1 [Salvelinus namaycush]
MKKVKGREVVIVNEKGAIVEHFPCCLIKKDETLVIYTFPKTKTPAIDGKRELEQGKELAQGKEQQQKSTFVTSCVEVTGGKNITSKEILKHQKRKNFSPLCIYAKSGDTVKSALEADGRFSDIVFEKTCTLCEEPQKQTNITMSTVVNKLEDRRFQIFLKEPTNRKVLGTTKSKISDTRFKSEGDTTQPSQSNPSSTSEEGPSQSNPSSTSEEGPSVGNMTQKRQANKKQKYIPMPDSREIQQILCDQFKGLLDHMKSRYPQEKSESEVIELMREEFGKKPESFTEVYRLIELAEVTTSVCKVEHELIEGTGFLLFDNLILTNGHLFKDKGVLQGKTLLVPTTVTFNFDNALGSGQWKVNVKPEVVALQYGVDRWGRQVDYAILELSTPLKGKKFPPGLLQKYGPVPQTGGIYIVGHPDGGIKKMDSTTIIEVEQRNAAEIKHLGENQSSIMIIKESILGNELDKEFYEQIIQGKLDVLTYNTFCFNGASGSPVINPSHCQVINGIPVYGCQVIAMHTAGFSYKCKGTHETQSVIEYAIPLRTILENILFYLVETNNVQMLSRFTNVAMKNPHLFQLIACLIIEMVATLQPEYSDILKGIWNTISRSRKRDEMQKLIIDISAGTSGIGLRC